uniref:Estradiol 17-beta-dehydrogenase 2-like n=1 Tax=Sinocyclocheilus grahami TaxID=75366 RepID=A0A672QE79_SINGR
AFRVIKVTNLVLVSGCDSGFGHDLARFLDSAGMRVFAGLLDELSPGALKLKKDASPNLTVLQLDITNICIQTSALMLFFMTHLLWTGLWALVNNAGVLGYMCDGEILPIKMYKKCLDVNFIGSVEITQAFLPLIRQSKGRLIKVPLPGFAGYGASKAALISFNGAIRQELSRWGVKVIIIQPGAFKTSENKDPFTPRTITILMTIKYHEYCTVLGHVHTYAGIFINRVFPSVLKKISVHMKTQTHAMKHCQEHAKPTGGDIISTVKPCWSIRSLKNVPVGGDNSTGSDVTSQKLRFAVYTTTLQSEFLKLFTLAGVFENVRFQ